MPQRGRRRCGARARRGPEGVGDREEPACSPRLTLPPPSRPCAPRARRARRGDRPGAEGGTRCKPARAAGAAQVIAVDVARSRSRSRPPGRRRGARRDRGGRRRLRQGAHTAGAGSTCVRVAGGPPRRPAAPATLDQALDILSATPGASSRWRWRRGSTPMTSCAAQPRGPSWRVPAAGCYAPSARAAESSAEGCAAARPVHLTGLAGSTASRTRSRSPPTRRATGARPCQVLIHTDGRHRMRHRPPAKQAVARLRGARARASSPTCFVTSAIRTGPRGTASGRWARGRLCALERRAPPTSSRWAAAGDFLLLAAFIDSRSRDVRARQRPGCSPRSLYTLGRDLLDRRHRPWRCSVLAIDGFDGDELALEAMALPLFSRGAPRARLPRAEHGGGHDVPIEVGGAPVSLEARSRSPTSTASCSSRRTCSISLPLGVRGQGRAEASRWSLLQPAGRRDDAGRQGGNA